MTVKIEKDKKGKTWIVSVKDSEGFTKQINLDLPSLETLYIETSTILRNEGTGTNE